MKITQNNPGFMSMPQSTSSSSVNEQPLPVRDVVLGSNVIDTIKPAKSKKVQFNSIVSISLDSLRDMVFDLTPYATEERYRFIDCDAFVNRHTLQIYETVRLPSSFKQMYGVVSYVWLALPATPEDLLRDGSFRVFCGTHSDGTIREDGGPISMKILEYVCRWCLQASAPYFWLDRLCILQTSKRDKIWQISRMCKIYEGCEECIVLPAGLQRLASVSDETSWADRAWTYQETIVTWDYAIVLTKDWRTKPAGYKWLVDDECRWQYLQTFFVEGADLLVPRTIDNSDGEVLSDIEAPCLILGRNKQSIDTLQSIIRYKVWNFLSEDDEQIDEFAIQQLILQGIQMRTSSRPVDMVWSIVDLLDAQEELKARIGDFKENERFQATLALVEMILRDQDEDNPGESAFLDLPLWVSLETLDDVPTGRADVTSMLTLEKLATLLDHNQERDQDITIGYKVTPLSEWKYEVKYMEEFSTEGAKAIAKKIPEASLLTVYYGEEDRVMVEHEDEGHMEIVQYLDIKLGHRARSPVEEQGIELLSNAFVFAWSLRLTGHPVIRFYKLGLNDAHR